MPGHIPHDDIDPVKICALATDRLHQGQERYPPAVNRSREEVQLRGAALWAWRYFLPNVGRDEPMISECIRKQKAEDTVDQMNM